MPDDVRLVAGRYRLVDRLATGGMGTVWEGWDERLHRPVAVKLLHTQHGLSEADAQMAYNRAMREARITARLHHPHAVPVYDVVDSDGSPCLIMQFLPSKSLQQLVNDKGVLQPSEVARIGSEIASALAAAHSAGIVHRDVKPGNVLIAEDGTAKITDFGISHALGDVSLTSTGMLTGTPAYLAPEVARGEPSGPASDVFSLGATLYLALEGTPPFGADPNPMALLHRVALGDMVPPQRSAELTPLLLEMLSTDPARRPPMVDVTARLAAPLPGPASTTSPLPLRERPQPGPMAVAAPPAPPRDRERRVGVIAIIAAVVVVGLGIVIGLLLLGQSGGTTGAGPTQSVSSSRSPAASSRASTKTSPKSSATKSSSASTSSSSSTSSTSSSSTSSSSSATSTSSSVSGTGPATAAQLSQAVTDYYGLLPGNTDQGWSRLTAPYQQNPAGGRANYETFWSRIDSVDVGQVSANPPSSVTATVTYHFGDGRVVDERTSFGLVRQSGILKIATSKVQSSNTR